MVGISFAAIFVRLALPAPPIVTGFYRMLFASALVGAWLLVRGRALGLSRRTALAALASGLCFGTDLALWHTSIVHTSVATATLLVNTTPVHIGLYSVLVLRETLHGRFIAGAALALAGSAVLLGISWDDVDDARGALLALAAAVFYAGYLLLITAARRAADAVPALFLASLGATALLGLYAALAGNAFAGFPAASWAAMGGAALVSQVGGVMGIVWALRYLPTTVAAVALLAQPVGTALLGWWLLGEALGPLQALGGAAVLAGIALASQSSRSPGGGGAARLPSVRSGRLEASRRGEPMVKLVFCLRRRPEMSREEFQTYWHQNHAPLVTKHVEALRIRRYVQLHTLDDPINATLRDGRGGPEEYDGVAELWWDSLDDLAAAVSTLEGMEAGRALLEDERRFIDLASSPIWVGEEKPIIER